MKNVSVYTSKTRLLLPLIFICITGLSENSFSQAFVRKGDIVTYRGNTFEYSKSNKMDTVVVTDPIDGHHVVKYVSHDPMLVKMNKERIYNTNEVTVQPTPEGGNGTLEVHIVRGLSAELNKLPTGSYFLYVSNVVLDKKGKVVYYEYDGLSSEKNKVKISSAIKEAIAKKVDAVINSAPAYNPGKLDGHAVIVHTDIMLSMFKIAVKKHKATLERAF